jgi:hypothetical protein
VQLDLEGTAAISAMTEIANGDIPIEKPPPSLAHWQDFTVFSERRCFTRLWVVQELGLAKNPIFLCGMHAVPWTDLWYVNYCIIADPSASQLRTRHLMYRYGSDTSQRFSTSFRRLRPRLGCTRKYKSISSGGRYYRRFSTAMSYTTE